MRRFFSRTLARLLRYAFRLLYHQLAWSYDLVAWLVSFGRWRGWAETALEFLTPTEDGRVLELGFGPGHLQQGISARGIRCYGIDESRQMCRIARRRLARGAMRLVRGLGEALPLASGCMDAVIATFPAEYIFDARMLAGCQRVLRTGGEIIFLMGVKPGGVTFLDLALRILYKAADFEFQSRFGPADYLDRVRRIGFTIQVDEVHYKNDKIWMVRGHKV